MRWTNLKRLLGEPEMAERAANFLLATGKPSQFRHIKEFSCEDYTPERHTTGGAEEIDSQLSDCHSLRSSWLDPTSF